MQFAVRAFDRFQTGLLGSLCHVVEHRDVDGFLRHANTGTGQHHSDNQENRQGLLHV